MSYEITRASSQDREQYANHLAELYAKGLIRTQDELDHKMGLVLEAESLHQLHDLVEGLPWPENAQPRDYSIPRNFLPACLGGSLFGLTLAVAPAAALSGHHDALAATVTAVCMLWGIWIAVVSIVTMVAKGINWDDLRDDEKQKRREKDERGR